jgi:Leucine-rich repeat (LRR) protein
MTLILKKCFLLAILIFFCSINLTQQCQLANETCECNNTFIFCLEEAKTFPSMLDLNLLIAKNSIKNFFIQNKKFSTVWSQKSLSATALYIVDNDIDFLDKNSFEGATSLTNLDLNNNQLKNVESYTFYRLINLKYLYLYSNNLKVLKSFTFGNLVNLNTLELRDNDIDTIEEDAFIGLNKLKKLYLSSNKIKHVTVETFKHLTNNIQTLLLDQNEISDIEPYSFSKMTNLGELYFQTNQLTSIRNGTFFNLTNCFNLQLSKNELNKLDLYTFDGMTNLKELRIYTNSIESIHSDAFASLRNLETFEINSNELSDLPKSLLKNIEKLKTLILDGNKFKLFSMDLPRSLNKLDLSYNEISFINRSSFENLKDLTILKMRSNRMWELNFIRPLVSLIEFDFSQNLLIKIQNNVFQNLSKLKNLNLSQNYLDGFDEDIFRGLFSLEKLDLSFNYIKLLGKNFLNHMYSLKVLHLSSNGLKQIEEYSFKHLEQLNELNLQSNKLFKLSENRTFSNLSSLKNLNLRSNYFKSINESLKANLKQLTSLESLLMENNLVEFLNGNDFEFSVGLKTIDLNFNQIKFIHLETFAQLKNLSALYLSSTHMDFVELDILKGITLDKIDLSFNKIYIDEQNLILLNRLEFLGLESVNFGVGNYSYEIFSGVNLKYIDLSDNNLSLKNYEIINNAKLLEIIELRRVGLQSMRQINFKNLTNLMRIDLSHNNLTQIDYDSLAFLLKLNYLDLSFNQIEYIDERIFSMRIRNLQTKKLNYLNLESNRLLTVGYLFMNFLNLQTIIISENKIEFLPAFHSQFRGYANTKEIYVNKNNLKSIGMFSTWVNLMTILNFESNQIEIIEYNAFQNLKKLENISIANNCLRNLTANNFFYLYSLKYLSLSFNQIEFIEMNTFINLNKLVKLDLDFNRLILLEPNLFTGLDNLEDLHLLSHQSILWHNESFDNLASLNNLYLNVSMVTKYKCIFMHSIKRKVERSISNKYNFYRSLNILEYSSNIKENEHFCDLRLQLLQFKVHLNLKFDYENENFFEECKRTLIKKENNYKNTFEKCFVSNEFEKNETEMENSGLKLNYLTVISDYRYLLTMGCLILLLFLVSLLFVCSNKS